MSAREGEQQLQGLRQARAQGPGLARARVQQQEWELARVQRRQARAPEWASLQPDAKLEGRHRCRHWEREPELESERERPRQARASALGLVRKQEPEWAQQQRAQARVAEWESLPPDARLEERRQHRRCSEGLELQKSSESERERQERERFEPQEPGQPQVGHRVSCDVWRPVSAGEFGRRVVRG